MPKTTVTPKATETSGTKAAKSESTSTEISKSGAGKSGAGKSGAGKAGTGKSGGSKTGAGKTSSDNLNPEKTNSAKAKKSPAKDGRGSTSKATAANDSPPSGGESAKVSSKKPVKKSKEPARQAAPIVVDPVLLESADFARQALNEVTPPETVGPALGNVINDATTLTFHFAADLSGYPGWYWSITLARVDGGTPTVVESELLPGEGAIIAPAWVPWSERLEEYNAAQAALRAERKLAGLDENGDQLVNELDDELDDDELDDDELDDDDIDDALEGVLDGDELDDVDELDGVDIDSLEIDGVALDSAGTKNDQEFEPEPISTTVDGLNPDALDATDLNTGELDVIIDPLAPPRKTRRNRAAKK